MADLVLHPHTLSAIRIMEQNPPHAVLLHGLPGAGKPSVAKLIMHTALRLKTPDSVNSHPYVRIISPVKKTISIDEVRLLSDFLRLKTAGNGTIRRGIIIEDSQALTVEAQNALLKILEEPPLDTMIILTASSKKLLLPTIVSRAQPLYLKSPPMHLLKDYFEAKGHTSAATDRAYLLSGAQAGLMAAILENNTTHPLLEQVATAKKILTAETFGRLCLAETLSKKKEELPDLLYGMQQVTRAAMLAAAKKDNLTEAKKWHRRLGTIVKAKAALGLNPQPKLFLADLFLSL